MIPDIPFRKITAIIQQDCLAKVEQALQAMGIPGMSAVEIRGYGEYANFYSTDWMLTHTKVEIYIGKDRAEEVAMTIMDAAHTGMAGDGIIAIEPVESVYHIRTRKKCERDVCD